MHGGAATGPRRYLPLPVLVMIICSFIILGKQFNILFQTKFYPQLIEGVDSPHHHHHHRKIDVNKQQQLRRFVTNPTIVLKDTVTGRLEIKVTKEMNNSSSSSSSSSSNINNKNETSNSSSTSTTIDFHHHHHHENNKIKQHQLLPLLPWEVKAIETRVCRPDNGIPEHCCPGSFSAGGRMVYRENVCNDPQIYDQIEDYSKGYLFNISSIDAEVCDSCRIVDHLLEYNLTLSFVGDSVTSQTTQGFECELHRRGYRVKSKVIPWTRKERCGKRDCIGQKVQFTIQKPPSNQGHSEEEEKKEEVKVARINQYGIYRPDPLNEELKEEIIPNSDVIIFDHGLHWKPSEANLFSAAMVNYLTGFWGSNLTLLAWRETSAQHFDSDGGHYGLPKASRSCKPIFSKNKKGYRTPLMQRAAQGAGLAWRSVGERNFSSEPVEENELIFLPVSFFVMLFLTPCNKEYIQPSLNLLLLINVLFF